MESGPATMLNSEDDPIDVQDDPIDVQDVESLIHTLLPRSVYGSDPTSSEQNDAAEYHRARTEEREYHRARTEEREYHRARTEEREQHGIGRTGQDAMARPAGRNTQPTDLSSDESPGTGLDGSGTTNRPFWYAPSSSASDHLVPHQTLDRLQFAAFADPVSGRTESAAVLMWFVREETCYVLGQLVESGFLCCLGRATGGIISTSYGTRRRRS